MAAKIEAKRRLARPANKTASVAAPVTPAEAAEERAEEQRIARLLADADDIRDRREARAAPRTAPQANPDMTLRSESSSGGAWKWVLGSVLVGAGGTVAWLGGSSVKDANAGVAKGNYAGDYDAYRTEYDDSKTLIWYGTGGAAVGGAVLIWAMATYSSDDTAMSPARWLPVAWLGHGGSWILGGSVAY